MSIDGITTEWHHVSMVIDRSDNSFHAYLDGTSLSVIAGLTDTLLPGSTIETASPLLLGVDSNFGAAFDGMLDELAVFRAALTEQQVQKLAASVPPADATLATIPTSLDRLAYLSLASNGLSQIDPTLVAEYPALTYLQLNDNSIGDLRAFAHMPVIDAGDPGYTESAELWQENISPVENAFDEDYHFRSVDGSETSLAQWQFNGVSPGTYEVQVTWPETNLASTGVTFSMDDGVNTPQTFTVNQRWRRTARSQAVGRGRQSARLPQHPTSPSSRSPSAARPLGSWWQTRSGYCQPIRRLRNSKSSTCATIRSITIRETR